MNLLSSFINSVKLISKCAPGISSNIKLLQDSRRSIHTQCVNISSILNNRFSALTVQGMFYKSLLV